jgi:tetratricopeptide (TPR) repeat protein
MVIAGWSGRRTGWSAQAWLVAWFGVLTSLAPPAESRELWERPWVEVRSPNFRVVSALDERQAREFVIELENFRQFVGAVTNVGAVRERVPTTAFLLPERRPEFGFTGDVRGFMRPTMRGNDIALVPSGGFLDDFLRHEYVHMIVHNRGDILYPTWFDEGFAELLMTFEIKGDQIAFGKVNRIRASWLNSDQQVMPFDRLLEVGRTRPIDREQVAMFYAQSWLLMHYLNFGRPEANFSADTAEYLRLTQAGTAPVPAFEQAYRLKVGDLRAMLRKYSAKQFGFFRGTLPNAYAGKDVVARPLPEDAIATELGWLLVNAGKEDVAAPYFAAALAKAPANSRALAGQAQVVLAAGDLTVAGDLLARAVAADPGNALNELDFGEYYAVVGNRARKAGKAAEATTAFTEARKHYARSYKLNPDLPETLAMNGQSYLDEGIKPDKAVESLEMATELLPGYAGLRLMLARALVASGEKAAARPHVMAVVARSHGDVSPSLQELLDTIDGKPAAP